MSKYNVGDEIINIHNPSEKGVIIKVNPLKRGFQTYIVRYENSTETELEQNLETITDSDNPFELLMKGVFHSYIDFQQKNTSVKLRNTSNNTISSLKASKTIFYPYQYKPLLKYLYSDKRRILIGDEVGIGKTIEAGHIMLELIGRQEMKNGLIICPKSLTQKWQDELVNKFNINFKIYENKADFIADLKYRPSVFKGIINYEKLRVGRSWKDKKERTSRKHIGNDLIDYIAENNIIFDLVVCDESHKLRNPTQTSRGVERIIKSANGVLFLSATPIMTDKRNLYNQLKLLDSETYSDFKVFENQDRINRPIIKALNQLNNNLDFKTILKGLKNNEIYLSYTKEEENQEDSLSVEKMLLSDVFQEDQLYQKVISDLELLPENPENRVKIQYNLSSLNTLNTILTRTRKKDVTTDWFNAVRESKLLIAKLTKEESTLYYKIISEHQRNNGLDNNLGITQIKRQLSSCLYGYLGRNNDNFRKYQDKNDSKYTELKKVINEVVRVNRKKLIVFATYKATLKYLQFRLDNEGIRSEIISGDVQERNEVINKFKLDKNIDLLLSSEVGSEGIDLQFCDSIVNYDLPWNPMVVEQRIGRIHRFGQKSPIVHIYTIVVEGSIEKDIYELLLERIGIFRSSIGELEPILEDYRGKDIFGELDKVLQSNKLTDEQRRIKLDDISKAIAQGKLDLEEIKSGLADSITNDIYFDNEIRKINENYMYVAENEIINFVKALIDNKLQYVTLNIIGNSVYKLSIPRNEKGSFLRFLNDYSPPYTDFDNYNLYQSFINQIKDLDELILTFQQEVANENKSICFVNAYHPLVLAINNFFKKSVRKKYTFQFRLPSSFGLMTGSFLMGVYSLNIIKENLREKKNKELLVPLVYDIERNQILDGDIAEKMLGYSQQYASANFKETEISKSIHEMVEIEMPLKINAIRQEIKKEEEMKMNSYLKRREKQEQQLLKFRIEHVKNTIAELLKARKDNAPNALKRLAILPALERNIENMRNEMETKSSYFNSFKINTKVELLSLSLINIY